MTGTMRKKGERYTGIRFADYVGAGNHRLVLPWMSVIGLSLADFKYTLQDVYRSPEIQLEIAGLMDEKFGIDFVFPMDDGSLWAETVGLPHLFPMYDFPSVTKPLVKNREDLARLKICDPHRDGRMPESLEALKLIGEHFDKPLATTLEGPFTFAGKLAGISDLARAIIRDPDFVTRVTDFTTEVVAHYAVAAVENGLDFLSIAEPTAILLSPDQFERFVAGNIRKIFARVNIWKTLHVCGDSVHLFDQILGCGADGLSLDQLVDLKALAPKVPPEVVIFGNIDPIYVLHDLSPDQVHEKTVALLRNMAEYRNFIMSTGCDCLPNTPPENLLSMIRAAHTPPGEL